MRAALMNGTRAGTLPCAGLLSKGPSPLMLRPDVALSRRSAMSTPFTQPDFWNVRYASGCTPWDFGGVPSRLARHLQTQELAGQRILIPGCGSGHEIAAFARAGADVTAIDFSPVAVAKARARLPVELASAVIEGDFFTHPFGPARFDFIYERTFLCALDPKLWRPLTVRLAELLGAGGLVAGFYFYGDKEDGPPFGLEPAEAAALFEPHFHLVSDEPVPAAESLPLFADRERWQVRRKREG